MESLRSTISTLSNDSCSFSYNTFVRFDLDILSNVVEDYKQAYLNLGSKKETTQQRSAFSAWNTSAKQLERLKYPHTGIKDGNTVILQLDGQAKGKSARVYYTPSVTSLAANVRKAIVPLTPGNKFLFFDIAAAEFFMSCVFAGEQDAVKAYHEGKDIYMEYAWLFPQESPRKVVKECLIANNYGVSPYRVGINCGISENQAGNLLLRVDRNLPALAANRIKILTTARKYGHYMAPNGFNQQDLVKISPVIGEFLPLTALSTYIQSALGLWMQAFIRDAVNQTTGTLLTIFDAALVEVTPLTEAAVAKWLETRLSPFRIGKVNSADTFYGAYRPENNGSVLV